MGNREAATAADLDAVTAAFDELGRHTTPFKTRELLPPCRCGWPDMYPLGTPPVRVPILDLSGKSGHLSLEICVSRATCAACKHPIPPDRAAVAHRLRLGGGIFNRYHPECVEIQ